VKEACSIQDLVQEDDGHLIRPGIAIKILWEHISTRSFGCSLKKHGIERARLIHELMDEGD
jgi:hypothetical protein